MAIQIAVVLTVIGILKALRHLAREQRLRMAHYEAREIQPAKGQVWIQDGEEENTIFIKDITADGSLVLASRNPHYNKNAATWKDTPESWRERFANRRLILG